MRTEVRVSSAGVTGAVSASDLDIVLGLEAGVGGGMLRLTAGITKVPDRMLHFFSPTKFKKQIMAGILLESFFGGC